MTRQKQVDECLSRCLEGKAPSDNHKLSASVSGGHLTLLHYHHVILVYDLRGHKVLHQWFEKPTDRRILEAALAFLRDTLRRGPLVAGQCEKAATTHTTSGTKSSRASIDAPSERPPVERVSLGQHGNCQIVRGAPVEDRGSIFVAQVAYPTRCEGAARAAIALMKSRGNANSAHHNISAYRITAEASTDGVKCDGSNDDGEARAGSRLLAMLKSEKVVDATVVVSRWFGGVNLGPARFQHICDAGRTLLQRCGHEPGKPLREDQFRNAGRGHTLNSSSPTLPSSEHAQSASSSLFSSSSPAPLCSPTDAAARREAAAAAAERRLMRVAPTPPSCSVQSSSVKRESPQRLETPPLKRACVGSLDSSTAVAKFGNDGSRGATNDPIGIESAGSGRTAIHQPGQNGVWTRSFPLHKSTAADAGRIDLDDQSDP